MLIADLIAVALIVCLVAWGARTGVAGTLTLAAFAAGAVAGAALAPLGLSDGRTDEFALVFALPAALLLGGLVAALVERRTVRLRRRFERLDRLRTPNMVGGVLLAGWIGVAAVWLLGAAVIQIAALREPVEASAIVGQLNAVLAPPGRERVREDRPFDSFPTVAGTGPPILPVDPRLTRDPQVLAADAKVVRIGVISCRGSGFGSGWIGADGVVVTNAHVVVAADVISVQLRGRGPGLAATTIWFDPRKDVALLRVPRLRGLRPLAIVPRPLAETLGAVIGFPLGNHAIRAARIGRTTSTIGGFMERNPPGFPAKLSGRLITPFRANVEPGNSGGPVVDAQGRVIAMTFGVLVGAPDGVGLTGMGVPTRFVSSALRRAGPPVDTGSC